MEFCYFIGGQFSAQQGLVIGQLIRHTYRIGAMLTIANHVLEKISYCLYIYIYKLNPDEEWSLNHVSNICNTAILDSYITAPFIFNLSLRIP